MVRRLALLLAIAGSMCLVAVAQPELALARDGTLSEVVAVLAGHTNLGAIVDEFGQGLLAYAATGNPDPEVLRFLVARGLDVNRPTLARWTPLMYAARYNPQPEIVRALLVLGANARLANQSGQRAIDLVASNPNPAFAAHPAMALLIAASVPVAVAAPVTPTARSAPAAAPAPARVCCRICRTGKACGNTCISRSYTCRTPPGCACNALLPRDGPQQWLAGMPGLFSAFWDAEVLWPDLSCPPPIDVAMR